MKSTDKIDAIIHNKTEAAQSYKKITEKQWTVYYYLLSISDYNLRQREDHRYVYKSDINVSAVSKILGIARSTFYKAIEVLKEKRLIWCYDNYYTLDLPSSYAEISRNLLSQLLSYRKVLSIDLLRTYLFCSINYKMGTRKGFTKRNLISCLGYPVTTAEYYSKMDIYLDLLRSWGLVQFSTTVEQTELGNIRLYKIERIYDSSDILDERFDCIQDYAPANIGLTEEEEERIKKELNWK